MQATNTHLRAVGKRLCRWSVILLPALLIMTGCQKPDDSWQRIAESGVLRVGIDPTFPPFALAEGDTIKGIDVDLAHALAGEMGLQAEFTYFGYDGLYDALTTGQVDVLISALVIAPERTQDVVYSTPYFDAGLILIYSPEKDDITDIADLDGRVVAVELGALGHVEALNRQSRLPAMEVRTFGSADEALAAVASGEADAALVDSIGGRLYLREHAAGGRSLAYVAHPVVSEPYAAVVRIEDRKLLEKLNQALATLGDNGTVNQLIIDHLDP